MKKSLEDIEYEIKLNELEKLKKDNRKFANVSPTLVTLIVAFITVFGSFVASYIQKNNELELERQKFESELIMSAVKTNDSTSCKNNLNFLINVGLIRSNAVKLRSVLDNSQIPLLKLEPYSGINPVYALDGTVLLPENVLPKDVTVSLWPRTINGDMEILKQIVPLNVRGHFKIENLEGIGYILQIKNKQKVLFNELYFPDKKNKNDTKIFDLRSKGQ